jgi:hypothetical protein
MNTSAAAVLNREEQYAKLVLEDKGAVVTPIPRTSDKTPDFDVQFGAHYIIEVKTREEDQARVQERHATLARGEVHGDHAELQRKNTTSGIIEDGAKQLGGYGPPEAFRVLWVHCSDPWGERYKHQFFNALYGSTRLYDLDDTDFKVDALYFRDSDFFRYRAHLDGAVIIMELPGTDETKLFCLANDHSAKYQTFRTSPLAQTFPVGFYDPAGAEAAGEAVVVRGAFDRRDANAVMAHLNQATGRRTLYNMDFNHASATIAVPRDLVR